MIYFNIIIFIKYTLF